MERFLKKFKRGTQYVNIVSAVGENELTNVNNFTDEYIHNKCVKFIPASGAATRMFKNLYEFLDNKNYTEYIKCFFDHLEEFAFYEDIKEFLKLNHIDHSTIEGQVEIIDIILENKLNYGNLPKALIKMHAYGEYSATPIDEHIYEGKRYMDTVNLHFTISEAHERLFLKYIESRSQNIHITHSFQKKHTDTLAVDMDNEPFLFDNGEVLYRAGGHGALIENLNDLDADIIFIKNIDNVCHRDHVEDTIHSKKMLASIGLEVKNCIDGYIKQIQSGKYDLSEIKLFIKETLNITFKVELTVEKALNLLNRPLRVCGVVKNQGEPGGGPFVVDNGDYLDLQICEKAEINIMDESYKKIFNDSKYFNPVDLVCFTKDYKGEKYNLMNFINEERYFISEKTFKGRKLKALEHPGLWNGAMHHWNTLFVEVPLLTFNPVKMVNDLLREGHVGRKL